MRYPLHQSVRLRGRTATYETYDEETFQMLSEAFYSVHPEMSPGDLCEEQTMGVSVHGAEWEKTQGALMDYIYFKQGSLMVSVSTF